MKLKAAPRTIIGAMATTVALLSWSISQAQEAPASSETPAPAETTPAPAATPSVEATPVPEAAPAPEATPAPTKKGTKGKKKAEDKNGADAQLNLKEAPGPIESLLVDKLSLGAGFGLKLVGSEDISSDLLSYYFNATYNIMPFPILPGTTLQAALQYHTYTGVIGSKDKSYDVQSYLVGVGGSLSIPGIEKLAAQVTPYLGFSRTIDWEMVKYTLGDPEYGAAAALDARAIYTVLDRVAVFAGAGFKVQPHLWTELQIGAQGTF